MENGKLIEEREKWHHKTHMKETKDQIQHLQNESHRIVIDHNIKSKTNVTYKMLSFFSSRKINNTDHELDELKTHTKVLKK